MIKFIVVIDEDFGLADDKGIPWQGKIPTDTKFFRDSTIHSEILMGWVTYMEFSKPLPDRRNYVDNSRGITLRPGFISINNISTFLDDYLGKDKPDMWVIGGAALFTKTIDVADELYITRVHAKYDCTKFFPSFKQEFKLQTSSSTIAENNISFHFEVWDKI